MPQAYLSIQFLAELYVVGDENLMERAGFVVPTRSRSNVEQRHGGGGDLCRSQGGSLICRAAQSWTVRQVPKLAVLT